MLKQVELGMAVADACRKMGISEQTFYRWKKQYGSLEPDQARELKQLQEENARLKKLVSAAIGMVFLQETPEAARTQWGSVADCP